MKNNNWILIALGGIVVYWYTKRKDQSPPSPPPPPPPSPPLSRCGELAMKYAEFIKYTIRGTLSTIPARTMQWNTGWPVPNPSEVAEMVSCGLLPQLRQV